MNQYVIVPVDNFFVLLDQSLQQKDLIPGRPVLLFHSEGEPEIFFYQEDHGYGMGALDLEGRSCTIRYSSCTVIVGIIGKEIQGIPSINLQNCNLIK